jgi:hypothetical protein
MVSVLTRDGMGTPMLIIKGAPEAVLDRCVVPGVPGPAQGRHVQVWVGRIGVFRTESG